MSNTAQKLTVIEGGKSLSLVKSEINLKASAKRIREIQQEEAKLKREKEQLMSSLVDNLDQGTHIFDDVQVIVSEKVRETCSLEDLSNNLKSTSYTKRVQPFLKESFDLTRAKKEMSRVDYEKFIQPSVTSKKSISATVKAKKQS